MSLAYVNANGWLVSIGHVHAYLSPEAVRFDGAPHLDHSISRELRPADEVAVKKTYAG